MLRTCQPPYGPYSSPVGIAASVRSPRETEDRPGIPSRSAVRTIHRWWPCRPRKGPRSGPYAVHQQPVPRSRACTTIPRPVNLAIGPRAGLLHFVPRQIPSAGRSGALAAILSPKKHRAPPRTPRRVRCADHPPQWPCRAGQDRIGSGTCPQSSTSHLSATPAWGCATGIPSSLNDSPADTVTKAGRQPVVRRGFHGAARGVCPRAPLRPPAWQAGGLGDSVGVQLPATSPARRDYIV
jgi:hypothetical protein